MNSDRFMLATGHSKVESLLISIVQAGAARIRRTTIMDQLGLGNREGAWIRVPSRLIAWFISALSA